MYHSIAPVSTDYLTIPCGRFVQHVDHLAARHAVVGLRDVVAAMDAGAPLPPDAVVVTFDDGLRDNVEHAVPVLESRGIRGVFFAIAGVLGGDTRWDHKAFRIAPHMTADDLRSLVRAGHEVGNHTFTHQRLPKLSYDEQAREIGEAHAVLTSILGCAPVALAYPYGDADGACAELCRERYRFGFTTVRDGVFDWLDDSARIRRIYVAPDDGPVELDRKIACYRQGVQHA